MTLLIDLVHYINSKKSNKNGTHTNLTLVYRSVFKGLSDGVLILALCVVLQKQLAIENFQPISSTPCERAIKTKFHSLCQIVFGILFDLLSSYNIPTSRDKNFKPFF